MPDKFNLQNGSASCMFLTYIVDHKHRHFFSTKMPTNTVLYN